MAGPTLGASAPATHQAERVQQRCSAQLVYLPGSAPAPVLNPARTRGRLPRGIHSLAVKRRVQRNVLADLVRRLEEREHELAHEIVLIDSYLRGLLWPSSPSKDLRIPPSLRIDVVNEQRARAAKLAELDACKAQRIAADVRLAALHAAVLIQGREVCHA